MRTASQSLARGAEAGPCSDCGKLLHPCLVAVHQVSGSCKQQLCTVYIKILQAPRQIKRAETTLDRRLPDDLTVAEVVCVACLGCCALTVHSLVQTDTA